MSVASRRDKTARAARSNQNRCCSILGCNRSRRGLSRYCRAHRNRARYYGSPVGRRIRRQECWHERETVEAFFERYKEQPPMHAALRWADEYLKNATLRQAVPGQRDIARIAADGVTGKHIICEVLTLWLFARWHPKTLSEDEPLTYQLGTSVLYLAPRYQSGKRLDGSTRYQQIGGQARKAVGLYIRQALGVFALNALAAITRDIQAERSLGDDLLKPFIQPTALPAQSSTTK